MRRDSAVDIETMKVDGGASQNDFLMQFQADMLNADVVRPAESEATSLGAAYMAGLAVGFWDNPQDCFAGQATDKVFTPQMSSEQREELYADWTKAVKRSMEWAK